MSKKTKNLHIILNNIETISLVEIINKHSRGKLKDIVEYALLCLFSERGIEENRTYLEMVLGYEIMQKLQEKNAYPALLEELNRTSRHKPKKTCLKEEKERNVSDSISICLPEIEEESLFWGR